MLSVKVLNFLAPILPKPIIKTFWIVLFSINISYLCVFENIIAFKKLFYTYFTFIMTFALFNLSVLSCNHS